MSSQPDKRFLIVVLVFGIVGTAAGVRWLSHGEIVVRRGQTRVGVGQGRPPPAARPAGPAAGRVGGDHLLYYPICVAWIALGASMVALAALSFFTGNVTCLKLSAYSCLAVLLLGFATLAAALWSGP